jgi:hypothetical protein
MEPWHKVVTPRKEVREGRSFNPDAICDLGSDGNGVEHAELTYLPHSPGRSHRAGDFSRQLVSKKSPLTPLFQRGENNILFESVT